MTKLEDKVLCEQEANLGMRLPRGSIYVKIGKNTRFQYCQYNAEQCAYIGPKVTVGIFKEPVYLCNVPKTINDNDDRPISQNP